VVVAQDFLDGVTESIDGVAARVTNIAGALEAHCNALRAPVEALQANWSSSARPGFDAAFEAYQGTARKLQEAIVKLGDDGSFASRTYTAADDAAKAAVANVQSLAAPLGGALKA
jgi:WXG100 family type VII secretion target